jgi:hypothetical protein
MSSLPERLKQYVRNRASNRCEYCLSHQNYILGHLQVDHIQPMSKGRTDKDTNLCLACELCNQYKWTQTEGIDPQARETVVLFNPRQYQWTEHFAWSDCSTRIVGKTACGRATIEALKLNNPLAVTVRRNWVGAGWHPPTP